MPDTQIRRIAAGAVEFLLVASADGAAMGRDPRFTDYVSTIKSAGLRRVVEHVQGVTIFTPTNDAFAAVGGYWRDHVLPMTILDDGDVTLRRAEKESFVEGAEIRGKYPGDHFRGKVPRVNAESGVYFTVDGTQPGKLVINPGETSNEATIGFVPPKERTIMADALIVAIRVYLPDERLCRDVRCPT